MSILRLVLQFLLFSLVLVSGKFLYHRSYKYSPELIAELKDFEKLIPTVTIDEVVAEHMITDSGFRKAIKFLRSSDFKRLQQRIESLPEVVDLINFVHLNDTTQETVEKYWYRNNTYNRLRRSTYLREQIVLVLLESGSEFTQHELTHENCMQLIARWRTCTPTLVRIEINMQTGQTTVIRHDMPCNLPASYWPIIPAFSPLV